MLTPIVLSAHNVKPAVRRESLKITKFFGGGRMSKRSYALLTVLVLASIVLAACGAAGGGAKPIIKIATQSPLSGGQSQLGVGIKQGAELALEQLSGPLKDMGFDVQLARMMTRQLL